MAIAAKPSPKVSFATVIIVLVFVFVGGIGVFYLQRPSATSAPDDNASAEAKNYLRNLQLSDVTMQATENFMQQQVVEIQGKIANLGPRKLASVEVYCLFSAVDGKELYRERLPIVKLLAPQETRAFRLPFDSLPQGWNQAMPRLVIARISFAS